MPNETIADICSEMKREAGAGDYKLIEFSDRIEAAAKRDEREADCTNCDYANVVAENERLRAALKPVLECDGTVGDSMYAVREAQRIAREGVAK